MALADHFKVNMCAKQNIDYDKLFHSKDSHIRRLLQLEGTENGRMAFGEDIWIRTLDTWMKLYSERGIKRFIITDIRFENEFDYVKSKGGKIILVKASNRNNEELIKETNGNINKIEEIQTHTSEQGLENKRIFDYVIENDTNNHETMLMNIDEIIKNIYE